MMGRRTALFSVCLLVAHCGAETATPTPVTDTVEPQEVVGPAPDTDAGIVDTPTPEDGAVDVGLDTAADILDVADTSTECLSDEDYFEEHLWKPTLRVKCYVCHSEPGIAKDTQLVLQPEEVPNALELNFEMVQALAVTDVGGVSLLLNKPTNTHGQGHTGGEQFKVGSVEYKHFEHFVERVTGVIDPCANPLPPIEVCETVEPGIRKMRRLTRFEYDRTVSDLLGIESTYGHDFTPETMVHGFDNNADALQVNALYADQVRSAAEKLAKAVMGNPTAAWTCSSPSDSACVQAQITSFGKRAFRRPLTEAEVSRYEVLFALAAVEDGVAAGFELVLSAFLQSANFLYRPEIGVLNESTGLYELNAYEIASELSYLLWGSMPDDELFASADSGALLDPAEIHTQVVRMIASPKTRAMVTHFGRLWLEIENLMAQPKDTKSFPEFTEPIRGSLLEETARFLNHVILDQKGSLSDLLEADYSMLNGALTAYYGVAPTDGADPSSYTLTDLSNGPYGGLLRHGSVTARHAFPAQSSPIHRGVLIRERFLCQDLPPPPPGIVVQVPELKEGLTTRERFAAHSEQEPCHSCHQLIDPIGFGFESFDAVGRHRETASGKPVDESGEIINSVSTDGSFSGVGDLSTVLAQSTEVHECFALQWFRFAYGVDEDPTLDCLLADITQSFVSQGTQVESLWLALAQTPHFTHRKSLPDDDVPPDEPIPVEDTGGESDGGTVNPPLPEQELEVSPETNSDWNTGYCMNVTVKNLGAVAVQWVFSMPVEGTISQIWNATATPYGDEIMFQGVAWNGNLAPDQSADFGFCADK